MIKPDGKHLEGCPGNADFFIVSRGFLAWKFDWVLATSRKEEEKC